jgi:glycosyltransferase involved in cell wall biosynthesis
MIAPTSFFAHYGGHIRILEETKALQARGHQVTIVTYHLGQDVPGIDIRRTPPLPYRSNYEVGSSRHKLAFDAYLGIKSLQTCFQIRPDIIHGHMHEGALIGGLLSRLWRKPLVFDFQGSLTGEMVDHGFINPQGMTYKMVRRAETFISRRLPQAILTSSERAQGLLQQEFGVPPEVIVPLPDCANLELFDPDGFSEEARAAVKLEFGIPAERPVVAYLGLLADYQGTHQLVQAAALLKQQGSDLHFLIMGYPNVDRYREMARHMEVDDRITFTGRVDYVRDAARFLAVGDIAVSVKLSTSEGSGKVLNYMAMAQPVVAYETRVHREYLGEWGSYVPAGNVSLLAERLQALAQDRERRRCLGKKLRQRAEARYSWPAAAERIESVYQRLTLT